MQKKQGLGSIVALEIPNTLQQYNTENGVTRARLVFSFVGGNAANENDITSQLLGRVGNNTYSVIIDVSDLGLAKAQAMFVGKTATFTVYSFSILELTENNYTMVNNGEREYSSLSSPHIGEMLDTETAFNQIRSRLSKDLESGRLFLGKLPQQPMQQGGQQQPMQQPMQGGQFAQPQMPLQQGGNPY